MEPITLDFDMAEALRRLRDDGHVGTAAALQQILNLIDDLGEEDTPEHVSNLRQDISR